MFLMKGISKKESIKNPFFNKERNASLFRQRNFFMPYRLGSSLVNGRILERLGL